MGRSDQSALVARAETIPLAYYDAVMKSLLQQLLPNRTAGIEDAPAPAAVSEDAAPFFAGPSSAGPFSAGKEQVGVLLCHGFTGSPRSLRAWADQLLAAGFRVSLPRLPGHGTSWQDLNRTQWTDWYAVVDREFAILSAECRQVFVAGLSMGGGLALRLAEQHHDKIAGLVLVNPAIMLSDKRLLVLPVLRRLMPSLAGIASDIAKPQVDEGGYSRTPLNALASQTLLWRDIRKNLAGVDQPLLIFRSLVDHVVDPSSVALICQAVSSTEVTERLLHRSYHVATMDYDAEDIFTESIEFINRVLSARQADADS